MFIETRNPFFDIMEKPLMTIDGDSVNRNALINAETGDVVGIVSSGYKLIKNKDVADMFDSAFSGMNIERVSDHMDGTTKRWKRKYLFSKDQFSFYVGNKQDLIQLEVEVFNGYDGKTSYGFNIQTVRKVCTNGMVVMDRLLLSQKFTHFIDNATFLTHSFVDKIKYLDRTRMVWNKWSEIEFDRKSVSDYFWSRTPNLSEVFVNYMMNNYDEYMSLFNEKPTLWSAFNSITYAATHKTKARKGSPIFSKRFNMLVKLSNDFYEDFKEAA